MTRLQRQAAQAKIDYAIAKKRVEELEYAATLDKRGNVFIRDYCVNFKASFYFNYFKAEHIKEARKALDFLLDNLTEIKELQQTMKKAQRIIDKNANTERLTELTQYKQNYAKSLRLVNQKIDLIKFHLRPNKKPTKRRANDKKQG
jgi:hypothetical protein